MKDRIEKELLLNQPINAVWNAISKGDEISAWFLKADFKPEVGYKYTFTSPDEKCNPIVGEVKEANPYTLAYTWIEEGVDVVTTVRWTLTEVNNGTHLFLEHFGISNYDEQSVVKMFDSFSGGWENCLNGIKAYLKSTVNAG